MSHFKGTSKSRKGEAAQLEMTPMIDVVFQLLIFFIVTLKQQDILSQLEISRPAPDPNPPPEVEPDELLTIEVYNQKRFGGEGYVLRGRRVSLDTLDRQFGRLAKYNKNMSVIIKCTSDSPHANLIKLLNMCQKSGLRNLAVFSM